MKERPILFSTEMVKAILDGRKSMTRRVVSFKGCKPFDNSASWPYVKKLDDGTWMWSDAPSFQYPKDYMKDGVKCPYGGIGSHLWAREIHYLFGHWAKDGLPKTGKQRWGFRNEIKGEVLYDDCKPDYVKTKRTERGWFKRPSIFMPRWASRITLEITNIKVEKIQDISLDDCLEEGIAPEWGVGGKVRFRMLWDGINSKRGYGWDDNPYVWCIEFRRV